MDQAFVFITALENMTAVKETLIETFDAYLALNDGYSAYQKYVSESSDFSLYAKMTAAYTEKVAEFESKILLKKIEHNVILEELRTKFGVTTFLPMPV